MDFNRERPFMSRTHNLTATLLNLFHINYLEKNCIFLFYVYGCFACMLYMYAWCSGQKRVLDSLELELKTAVSCHVGAGN